MGLVRQSGQCQTQRDGHIRRVTCCLTAGQQVSLAGAEQRQVPGQGSPSGLHVGSGLFQGQRQPAQLGGKLHGRRLIQVTSPVHQEARRYLLTEHRHSQRLAGRPPTRW